jgi:hypothetical protein
MCDVIDGPKGIMLSVISLVPKDDAELSDIYVECNSFIAFKSQCHKNKVDLVEGESKMVAARNCRRFREMLLKGHKI